MQKEIIIKLTAKLKRLQKNYKSVNELLQEETNEKIGENLVNIQSLFNEKLKLEEEIQQVKEDIEKVKNEKNPKKVFTIDLNGNLREVAIVLPNFADPTRGLISKHSPLAKALENSELGQTVEYSTPVGIKFCKVVSVNYQF